MQITEFVNVFRKEHGDTMYIPKTVQEKYSSIYELIGEETEKVVEIIEEVVDVVEDVVEIVEDVVKKPRTRKGK